MDAQLTPIIEAFQSRQPMRAKSLIITFFGDVVSQHGKTLWLSSVAHALEPLGINDRLVRTSVFRLVKEGWLEVEKIGRKSFYGFSEFGSIEYQRAAKRIYALDNEAWRGGWQILLATAVPEKQREPLKRSLNWLGFRQMTTGTFARPGGDDTDLRDVIEEFALEDSVLVMDATSSPISSRRTLKQTVQDNWALEELAAEYNSLIRQFRPLRAALDKGKTPTDEQAFLARLLLIHDYRRTLLRDTPLPDDLLPSRWPGTTARQMVASLYTDLAAPSVAYIRSSLESEQGHLGAPVAGFNRRFSQR